MLRGSRRTPCRCAKQMHRHLFIIAVYTSLMLPSSRPQLQLLWMLWKRNAKVRMHLNLLFTCIITISINVLCADVIKKKKSCTLHELHWYLQKLIFRYHNPWVESSISQNCKILNSQVISKCTEGSGVVIFFPLFVFSCIRCVQLYEKCSFIFSCVRYAIRMIVCFSSVSTNLIVYAHSCLKRR